MSQDADRAVVNIRPEVRAAQDAYREHIRSNTWHPTHQGVAYDLAGNLMDGRNRFRAGAAAGVSLWFLVTRGVPAEAFAHIDRGMSRTAVHLVHIYGGKEAKGIGKLNAISRYVLAGTHGRGTSVSRDRLARFVAQNHDTLSAIALAAGTSATAYVPAIIAAFARFYFEASSEHLDEPFFALLRRYKEEDWTGPGDYLRLLKNDAMKLKMRGIGRRRNQLTWADGRQLFGKAYNAISKALSGVDPGKRLAFIEVPPFLA